VFRAGEYLKVPGTDAVALNCVLLNAVPDVIAAGVAQLASVQASALST
jgi:hypothetical protein